ncbi:MAG: T9SS type A sorting domain-containing protein [bacterium]|nr:T9SS type A sorting domain-containing protein [bacterium]
MRASEKSGEDVQRVSMQTIAMPITQVDMKSEREVKIAGFTGVAFRVDKMPKAPFALFSKANISLAFGQSVSIERDTIAVRITFQPITPGFYRDTVILRRKPPFPQQVDEIIIIVEGIAFVPKRTMHVDFQSVLVGDSTRRIVRVPSEFIATSQWTIIHPDPPYTVINKAPTSEPDPDVPGKFVYAFVLQFEPLVTGLKKGSVTFIRLRADNTTRILDTLVVEMTGTGEEFTRRADIQFGRMMTGDSSVKEAAIQLPDIGKTFYKIAYQPPATSPFQYIENYVRNGKLVVRASFAPYIVPQLSDNDVVVLYRVRDGGQFQFPLDSVVVSLYGTSGPMQRDTEVVFQNQFIGELDSVDIDLGIPVPYKLRSFSYDVVSSVSTSSRVWAIVIDPNVESPDTVRVRVYSKPDSLGKFSDVLYLRRLFESTEVIDTTTVAVRTEVRPRSINLRTSIARQTSKTNEQPVFDESSVMSARIGDTIVVAILAQTSDPIDLALQFNTLRCSLAYNPTVLVPVVNAGEQTVVLDDDALFVFGDASVTANAPLDRDGYVLARASFVAVMGDADNSMLALSGVTLEPRDLLVNDVGLDSATVQLTNVWNYQDGRSRFINSLQKNLQLDISPNPLTPDSKITWLNVTAGDGKLQIVNSQGVVVADLTNQLRAPNANQISFPSGLPTGIYYVRLTALADNSAVISSVVRLVIVNN